ncbi:conserved Plasmodium protein, unknown function [Plasmodium gallinaceum]|uniref:Uncharacterized protein n=1 Tax=Plasmodium gallinaceum TaxID=5849 RepID=A0A1J1GLZ2_PLAGA|nr:conserved Plasmodium protein, unknown function [Plasmodium gallinaceum]CRG93438.1 conserved Plasmodium protein, unknown function [Plasmodium gallinaceum]
MEKNDRKFIGGKLKLKVKKKKISKKKEILEEKKKNTSNENEHIKKKNINDEMNIINGSGRIVTIKNTIQGFETRFINEVKVGYEIILKHPTSLQEEKRVVTSILSNKTLLINEEFSTDISTTCTYFIKKVESKQEKNEDDNINLQYAKIIEQKPKNDVIKIRKKVGLWSYKIVDKKIKGNLTNEQKLDERVKSGRDKFCW